MKKISIFLFLCTALIACAQVPNEHKHDQNSDIGSFEIVKSEAEWRRILDSNEYHILREKGTERAGTGSLLYNKEVGTYCCKACGQALYSSKAKFNSGTGWPSFYEAFEGNVLEEQDNSYGMNRTEILCGRCGGHLGHVFNDGPAPTGRRHCVNSLSLKFINEDK